MIPLPVELSSFTAHHIGEGKTIIQWTTESQKNHDRFELMSSANAKEFETIHTLKGEENTSIFATYSHTDYAPRASDFLSAKNDRS